MGSRTFPATRLGDRQVDSSLSRAVGGSGGGRERQASQPAGRQASEQAGETAIVMVRSPHYPPLSAPIGCTLGRQFPHRAKGTWASQW
eukprot:11641764-Alexandrium_andersonii.AAC.1